ncbi:hypothetical protein HPP92_008514 [Vanilla planifolia]|uniref:Reverse transcriptase zinc-binding domain-containing protein n=1 Tax=Vanilla planifolia TaxID=51239 RepID=A0A835RCI8_VANPL|nr:hypothetical protein HPP92_008514 [Vanilla planifolia]
MVSYCTAALNPPKVVIKAIDRRLSQFFWGESKDSFKHHWASWNRLARPVSENGIGIINLSVKVHAQTAKLWWNVIHGDSPWACYMRDCYLSGRPSITNKPGDSPGWHRLFLFFFSRWIRPPEDEYCSAPTPVRSSHRGSGIDPQDLRRVLPNPLERFLGGSPPTWVGIPSPLLTGIQLVGQALLKTIQLPYNNALLWNKRIPEKVAIFTWRLLNNALLVPDALKCIGLSFASKCPFCPASEEDNHLFWSCSLSSPTWDWYEDKLGLPSSKHQSNRLFHWWSFKRSISSLAFSIPASICWIAWKAWNAALYSSKSCSADSFFWDTQGLLKSRYLYHGSKLDPLERLNLHHLGLL